MLAILSVAFTERTAKLTDGLKSANQHSFSLSVPNSSRELTMATMSVVAGVGVMVAHDAPDLSQQHHAAEPQPLHEFVLGAGVGLGNFLASVIGAEVKVSIGDGSALVGRVLLVEETQRTVPGSEEVIESVYSDLQLLSDEGEVMRVAMGSMRSVQVLGPRALPLTLTLTSAPILTLTRCLTLSCATRSTRRSGANSSSAGRRCRPLTTRSCASPPCIAALRRGPGPRRPRRPSCV